MFYVITRIILINGPDSLFDNIRNRTGNFDEFILATGPNIF